MENENTMLYDSLTITEAKSKYDEQVKDLLANKIILAWIMKYTVKEFTDYEIEEIMECIEGEPEVSKFPLNPGLTNSEIIRGMNTEDSVLNEGTIYFDIRFYVYLPDEEGTKIILNVEAQRNNTPGYDLVTRAIFYCARLLSSQLGVEFTNKRDNKVNYNKLKKVYSIWICPSSQLYKGDSIIEYHIEPNVLYGKQYKSRYDLLSAIMVHLNEKTLKSENKLIGMLSALLSEELSVGEKKLILERDYNIPMTRKIEKEVIEMCNLSQSIYEKGILEGEETGSRKGQIEMAVGLIKKGIDINIISESSSLSISELKEIRHKLISSNELEDNFNDTNLF